MSSPALDPLAAKAVEALVSNDPKFITIVKKMTVKALERQLWYMNHGTPEQQILVSSKFMPIIIKAMTASDGDKTAEEVHEKTRELISSVLPMNEDLDEDDDDDDEDINGNES